MRKLTFTLLAIGSMSISFAQIINGDMESWNSQQWSTPPGGSGNTYFDLGPSTTRPANFLRTLNEINDLPFPLTAPVVTFRSDTAHTGNYSARLTTGLFGTFIIPGFIGTGDVVIATQTINLGRPYTQRPDRFQAYYQYAPVSGDSAAFEIWFQQAGTIIGTGKQVIKGATSGWTMSSIDINWTAAGNPDTVVIIAASSAGYDLVNVTAGVGQVGSTFWIDDLSFEWGGVGVEEELINTNVKIYPNPVSNIINIQTSELPNNLLLNIFDASGKKVMNRNLNQSNEMIDISALSSGTYVLVLQDAFNLVHRSKFIKK